jgi:hypothetical protein
MADISARNMPVFFMMQLMEDLCSCQAETVIHGFFSFSIRPFTRSCVAVVASLSRSISIMTISPSLQPAGRSESGRVNRTDSSSRAINTARELSIRSIVALMLSRHYDLWSMIVPLPSLSVATSPLLPQTGVSRPIKRAVSFIFPLPE